MRIKHGYRNYLCYLVLLGFFTTMFFIQMLHHSNKKFDSESELETLIVNQKTNWNLKKSNRLKDLLQETNMMQSKVKLNKTHNVKKNIIGESKAPRNNLSENHTGNSAESLFSKITPFSLKNTDDSKFKLKIKATSVLTKVKTSSTTVAMKKKVLPTKKKNKRKNYFLSLKNPKMFNKVVNKHEFKFLKNESDFCSKNPELYILSVVHTAPKNFVNRKMIRETWGNESLYKSLKIRTLFFIGMSKNNATMQKIYKESQEHGDIVIQDYVDTYRNLTFKAMSWLQWVNENCKNVPYILKADDDTFINLFQLTKLLKSFDNTIKGKIPKVLMCRKRVSAAVLRKKSKWKVSEKEYPDDLYPPHCPGYAVVLGQGVIPLLHNASYYVPYYWIDDVYFTGMLTAKCSINIMNISSRYASINNRKKLVEGNGIFTYGKITDARLRKYWTEVYDIYTKNTTTPL